MTEYSLEFIGRTVEKMRAEQITFREEVLTRLDKIEMRMNKANIEAAAHRTRTRALEETVGAISAVIEEAGLTKDKGR